MSASGYLNHPEIASYRHEKEYTHVCFVESKILINFQIKKPRYLIARELRVGISDLPAMPAAD
jgi:hypothetical protein